MKRIIIGTAGHIDHGKTTLVKALTGVDTDRLKEEKKRGISIELGFAPLRLPGGQLAGIVDVPGHERFIRQMLAGASGMDLVLLVISADEGVMPQTREHLDIIELLGVEQGIIVITKKDLVDDEWLLMVEDEIKEYVKNSVARDWPILPVSAVSGENVNELLELITQLTEKVTEKPALGKARLPIDRVFTMTGFGTIVTGTLWSGTIRINDVLEIVPLSKQVRVRSLQVHNQKVDEALAGQRVAVNLQGVEVTEIRRGYVLATPGYLTPSYRVNASLMLLQSAPRTLKNWARVRFHLGTDEAMGRVVLLDHDEMLPGERGYAQIVLEKPVAAVKNDRYVLRFYSPVTTIGGGVVLDPNPPKQKRFNEDVLKQIAIQEEGTLKEVIQQELDRNPGLAFTVEELARAASVDNEQALDILCELEEDRLATALHVENRNYYMSMEGLFRIGQRIKDILNEYHSRYPLRRGMPREEMRTKHFKDYNTKLFAAVLARLEEEHVVSTTATHVQLPGQEPEIKEKTRSAIKSVLQLLNTQPMSPPALKELQDAIAAFEENPAEVLAYLEEEGKIVKVAEGMYFSAEALQTAREKLEIYFAGNKELSLAQARDLWDSSRKYTLPLLEYFDRLRVTKRVGDNRVFIAR